MKRIENQDLPENLFKVTKPGNNSTESIEIDTAPCGSNNMNDVNSAKNGYFKVLKLGNFKKI